MRFLFVFVIIWIFRKTSITNAASLVVLRSWISFNCSMGFLISWRTLKLGHLLPCAKVGRTDTRIVLRAEQCTWTGLSPSTTDGLQLSGLGSRNLGQPQIDTSQHPSPSLVLFLISFSALCLSVVLAINDNLLDILLTTSLWNRSTCTRHPSFGFTSWRL